jgi:hypothetical protein
MRLSRPRLIDEECGVAHKMNGKGNWIIRRNLSQCALSTTNPTWPDMSSKPNRCRWKPATNRQHRGPSSTFIKLLLGWNLPLTVAVGLWLGYHTKNSGGWRRRNKFHFTLTAMRCPLPCFWNICIGAFMDLDSLSCLVIRCGGKSVPSHETWIQPPLPLWPEADIVSFTWSRGRNTLQADQKVLALPCESL